MLAGSFELIITDLSKIINVINGKSSFLVKFRQALQPNLYNE